jgi:23S rRNA (guanosine2251-2'-O)-methyltransferase
MASSIHIFGFHSIEAMLNSSPELILNVFVQNGRRDRRMQDLLTKLENQKINYSSTDKNTLDRLAKAELHHGVLAEIALPTLPGQDKLIEHIKHSSINHLILILDSIQDPRNLGACLRSANAARVDCVVVNKDRSAPINALVHKASAGAIDQTKIFQVTNLARTIKQLQKNGIWVLGLDGLSNNSLYKANLCEPIALVMGSEGKGLRKLVKTSCDELVSIPMMGNIESLNVSVATGIALFESRRQRQTN